jgi:hypothetical protein
MKAFTYTLQNASGGDIESTMCCPSQSNDRCSEMQSPGEGQFSLTRFFFNAQTRQCDQFMYRGLKGTQVI